MPQVHLYGQSTVRLSDLDIKGTAATCGNPNLVCWVDDPDALDLTAPLELDRATFPESANVEFVARLGERHVRCGSSSGASGDALVRVWCVCRGRCRTGRSRS